MSSDPATTAFAAFCKTGNPEQLGVVFDRLAPELLLVAARLLAPGGDPSDVVQQTFMTALQQRRRYQQGRPVAPWLVGILLQHVRRERRRLRRRIDSRRLREGTAEDPAIVVATRDHAEAVRRAVTALPQPYRQVLQLHLIHGLPANAVATSLELPFRTVQSQLRRGLHQLRKQLPRLAVAPWTGRALELVRADVLRAASSFCGWLLLPFLKVAGLLALVPVCVLTAASMSTGGTAPPAPEVVPVASAPLPATAPHAGPDVDPAGVQFERELLQDPQPVCRVRLQLLRAEDETPLADAQVTARVWDKDAGGRLGAVREVGGVVSNARGEAVIGLPRANQRTAWIRIEAAGRIAICKWLPVPDRDQIAFEGLALWQAVPGRIRVRDQHGTPVPSLEVAVPDRMQHGFQREHAIRGRTDADGWTPALLLPAGDTQVTCHRVPIAFAQGEEVRVPLSVRGGDHEVTLQRPDPKDCIGGQLTGQEGEPMRGWVVLLRARDGAVLTVNMQGRLSTDAEGRFLLPVPDGEAGPFRIKGGIGQQDGQAGDATWERGATDALVRLRFPDGLALTVVDARTGEPVEDFGVVCLRVHAEQLGMITGDRDLRFAGRHPGGALFLGGVEAGDSRLLVLPASDDPCLPSGYLPVRIADTGVTRLTVKLQRPAPVRVRVTFGDGKPVAGSRVRLRARLSEKNDAWMRNIANKAGFHSTSWQGRIDLAMAVTDSSGVAEVPWQPWREPVIVRADGPGHVVCERELPSVDVNGEPIELRVGRGALLRGTVTAIGSWPALAVDSTSKPLDVPFDRMRPCVVLRNCADGALMRDCEDQAFAVQADGRFECPDVPPGRWQVLFQYNRTEGFAGMRTLLHRALVEVVTMPGKEHAVTFDLAECLPASVRGRIFLGGELRAASQLTLDSWGRDHQGRPVSNLCYSSEHFVRADGTYAAGVLAGDVELEAVIDGKTYRLFERVPVAPGEQKQFDLQFRHLVARVRLVRSDGTPVGNRLVRVAGDLITSSADGWLTFDPVRSLRCDIEVFEPGIERDGLLRMRYDDPRTRPVTIGGVTLDPGKALSEHQLTVREP